MRYPPRPLLAFFALAATLAFVIVLPDLADARVRRADGHRIHDLIQKLLPPWFHHAKPPLPIPPTPPNPLPPEPPTPPIPPVPNSGPAIVGVWDTLTMPASFSAIAHAHELRTWLEQQGVTWSQLDPAIANQVPPPPAWAKAIFDAAAADKLQPPYMYVIVAEKRNGHQLTPHAETIAGIKEKIADDLPKLPPAAAANLPRKGTGLLRRKPQSKLLEPSGQATPKLSAILSPLKPADFPDCDLRSAIPFIDDQGATSLCTSFAGVLLTEHARFAQFGPTNFRPLSAANIATRINGWGGASLTDVITALADQGVCTEKSQAENSQRLPSSWQNEARQYRWLKYYDAPDADPLGYTCAALARGLPAIIGISVSSNFSPDSNGRISYARGSGRGGHAVVACGHTPAGKIGWTLIANSWGQDWGQHGFAWIEDTFISSTDFDGPYVCTAVSAAAADTGPTLAVSRFLEIPARVDVTAPCKDGVCPGPNFRRLRQ